MAYTQEMLDKLESAIAQGVRKVKYSDREVEYRDLSEMERIRDQMKLSINSQPSTKRVKMSFSKGL